MLKYTLLTKTENDGYSDYEEAGEIESDCLPRVGEEIFYPQPSVKGIIPGSYRVHWVSHNINKFNSTKAIVRAIKNKS